MKLLFESDIDLRKISRSGQCFRLNSQGSIYTYGDTVITQEGSRILNCSKYTGVFYDNVDYGYVESVMMSHSSVMSVIAKYGHGLRIMRQPTFEMILTSILTQRSAVSRTTAIVNHLCGEFGGNFPTREQLLDFDWNSLHVGYREPYLRNATLVCDEHYIANLRDTKDTSKVIDELQKLEGVGPKVANCIALFGLERYDAFPIDTWIWKFIQKYFNGNFETTRFRDIRGVVQQYIFYFMWETRGAL